MQCWDAQLNPTDRSQSAATDDPAEPAGAGDAGLLEEWMSYDKTVKESGVWVSGESLADLTTATTVRVGQNGERNITDGPFAETREILGGFCVIDVPDLDVALDWAARCPGARDDLDLAEEVASEAIEAALVHWPVDGVPPKPGAWLTTTARRRAVDRLRRDQAYAARLAILQVEADRAGPAPAVQLDDDLPDERLQLFFTCAHPALPAEDRVALTLRCLAGLSTVEVARAFLVPPATMAKRIDRAKKGRSAHPARPVSRGRAGLPDGAAAGPYRPRTRSPATQTRRPAVSSTGRRHAARGRR